MRRILLDQNAPLGLRQILTGYDVKTAYDLGWHAIANGQLLSAAEAAGFAVMLTSDQNIAHQQNLSGRRIALVVLLTNHWLTVKSRAAAVLKACDEAGEGTFTVVAFPDRRAGDGRLHHRRSGPAASRLPRAPEWTFVGLPACCKREPEEVSRPAKPAEGRHVSRNGPLLGTTPTAALLA